MYIDYNDAEDFLNDICRASSNEDRPHIEILSMEKCFELVKKHFFIPPFFNKKSSDKLKMLTFSSKF